MATPRALTETDRHWLRRCVELAAQALADGDDPFGSVLVDGEGRLRAEDRNRTVTEADPTRHPEIDLARWAAQHLSADERRDATVYTSGEHCPMCAAAHAWVGLGRIVYVMSTEQLSALNAELGISPGPVAALPATTVAPSVLVQGPEPTLVAQVADLHRQAFERRSY